MDVMSLVALELSPSVDAAAKSLGKELGVSIRSRIEIRMESPMEDADAVIRLLTNVAASKVNAQNLARLYRHRWRIEAMFQRLEDVL
jgi:IS4 transposase